MSHPEFWDSLKLFVFTGIHEVDHRAINQQGGRKLISTALLVLKIRDNLCFQNHSFTIY